MLQKRQSKRAKKRPTPFSFPPSLEWEGSDGRWSTFALQIGRPVQNVRVLPGTTVSSVLVIDEKDGCPKKMPLPEGDTSCEDSRGLPYSSDKSLKWVPNSIFSIGIEQNLGLDSNGNFGFDDVTLGWQGSGGPTEQHQVVGSVADPRYWLGQFPLNLAPCNFTTYNSPQPSYMTSLKDNDQIPSLSWSYSAGAYYRSRQAYGSLTLGGYDENIVSSEDSVTVELNSDPYFNTLVNLADIRSNATDKPLLPGGEITALIESTVPYIYLPEESCKVFERTFKLTWNEEFELYLLDADTHKSLVSSNPSITFEIAQSGKSNSRSTNITLPYAAFDLTASYPVVDAQYLRSHNQTGPPRYFPLRRAQNETQYTLGRTFLQEAVLTVDHERQNFTIGPRQWPENYYSSKASKIKAIWPPGSPYANQPDRPNDGQLLSTGATVGVGVGSAVIFIILLALTGLFIYRRRRARKACQQLQSENGSETITSNSENECNEYNKGGSSANPSELCPQVEQQADSRPIHEVDGGFKGVHVDSRPVFEIGIAKNAEGY